MVPLKSLNNVSIHLAEDKDLQTVIDILLPAFLPDNTSNMRLRKTNKLKMTVTKRVTNGQTYILMKEDTPIGACVVEYIPIPTIVHINIVQEEKVSRHVGWFIHYILNNAFKTKTVFVLEPKEDFTSILTHVKRNVYRFKTTFVDNLNKLYKDS